MKPGERMAGKLDDQRSRTELEQLRERLHVHEDEVQSLLAGREVRHDEQQRHWRASHRHQRCGEHESHGPIRPRDVVRHAAYFISRCSEVDALALEHVRMIANLGVNRADVLPDNADEDELNGGHEEEAD